MGPDPAPTIVVAGNVTLQAGVAIGLMEILAQDNNTIVFEDPGALTIDAGALSVVSVDPSLQADLSFEGGPFTINGNINFGSSSVNVNSTQIDLSGRITTTGDITLDANALAFAPGVLYEASLTGKQQAGIDVFPGTEIEANNVTIYADANNDFITSDTSIGTSIGSTIADLLAAIRPEVGLADVLTQATIVISPGATIEARQDVNIQANAEATATLRTLGIISITATWARAEADATVDILSGASIVSDGGNIDIASVTTNQIDAESENLGVVSFRKLDFSFAMSMSSSTATTTVEQGASIDAKAAFGNVFISASSTKNDATSASGGSSSDLLAAALALSLANTDAETHANGTITAGGDVYITATSTTLEDSTKVLDSIGTGFKTPATNAAKRPAQPVGQLYSAILATAKNLYNTYIKNLTAEQVYMKTQSSQQKSQKVGIAAAVGFAASSNTAIAEVGSTGIVAASGNVSVASQVTDQMQTSAIAEVQPYTDPVVSGDAPSDPRFNQGTMARTKKNAAAIAVGVSIFDNNSQALIDPGASVDAAGSLNVQANTSIPFNDFNWNNFASTKLVGRRTSSKAWRTRTSTTSTRTLAFRMASTPGRRQRPPVRISAWRCRPTPWSSTTRPMPPSAAVRGSIRTRPTGLPTRACRSARPRTSSP